MSGETSSNEIRRKDLVLRIPGMDSVKVQKDVRFGHPEDDELALDLYYPPEAAEGKRFPLVLFVTGYPDAGFRRFFGCQAKEMQSFVSWGRLVAASGLVAVTHTNRKPATDAPAALQFLRRNAKSLHLDEARIGIWSSSGHVPTALSILIDNGESLKCAALSYGFMFDWEGSTTVADSAKQWGFANPCAGKSVADLSRDLPLFVARAGRDTFPGLNATIDSFVSRALARNLPISLVNHATGPHAFDQFHDSEESREIIKRILGFLRFHLGDATGHDGRNE